MPNPQTKRLLGPLVSALLAKNYIKVLLVGLAILVSFLAAADSSITGRVVAVADGDTLTVLDAEYESHKIRLAGIDAPEKAMAFGQVSKQKLSEMCFDKEARVDVINTDKYGRSVGDVHCDGVYANEEMVRGGYAWVYRHYDQGFESFYSLEQAAKEAGLGLWADLEPTAPWQWRHSRKIKD